MRRIFKGIAVGSAVAGSLVLGSGQAVAAPLWQSISGPFTSCAKTVGHTAVSGVNFQGCLIVNANMDAQVVLVVNNHSGRAVTISGQIESDFGNASCVQTTLNTGTQRACYGPTSALAQCREGHADVAGPYGGTVRFTVEGVVNEMESTKACNGYADPLD
ncbi:hypothetical protein ABZ611_14370 [Streptomyces sp. NPDC007861]|uniref:hypothetical protein n=1 Tax=Streptomyces sp. NPDC007861 TaxID=3154893 RepID=UPI0033E35A5B